MPIELGDNLSDGQTEVRSGVSEDGYGEKTYKFRPATACYVFL